MKPFAIATIALVFASNLCAQAPRREPTPNDTLKSPEVSADKKVTFRIYAPEAKAVSVGGDWISHGLGTGGPLAKDDKGVWSLTVGPLPPDFYSYTFTVDGVRTLDPKNPMIKQGVSSLDNMFLLPGTEAAYAETQPVPHGTIHLDWYQSSTLSTQRRLHVYTPPGYSAARQPLPVLYLLHGGGDEDSGWSTIGRAGFIMDNLLAAKKARPMLIVMPNGSLPRPENLAAPAPGGAPSPEFTARMAELQERFTRELMNDVVPHIEKNFRVQAGPQHRALAGLSMGGGQTLRVLTTHPDKFVSFSIWSAGGGRNAADFETRNADFLKNAAKVNASVKSLAIVVGDKDFALDGSKNLAAIFEKHGLKHTLQITGGGHTWINWRHYLNDLLPTLF